MEGDKFARLFFFFSDYLAKITVIHAGASVLIQLPYKEKGSMPGSDKTGLVINRSLFHPRHFFRGGNYK